MGKRQMHWRDGLDREEPKAVPKGPTFHAFSGWLVYQWELDIKAGILGTRGKTKTPFPERVALNCVQPSENRTEVFRVEIHESAGFSCPKARPSSSVHSACGSCELFLTCLHLHPDTHLNRNHSFHFKTAHAPRIKYSTQRFPYYSGGRLTPLVSQASSKHISEFTKIPFLSRANRTQFIDLYW